MKATVYILSFLFLSITIKGNTIKGFVLDEETKKGIYNVEVLLVDWTTEINTSNFKTYTTKTNEKGEFFFKFDKSITFGIAFYSKNYLPKKIHNLDSIKELNISLVKCSPKNSAKLFNLNNLPNESIISPYISISYKSFNNTINYSYPFYVGYDLKNNKKCKDTSTADLLILSTNDSTLDILKSHKKGGVVPIYNDNRPRTLLFFEQLIAPEFGYKQTHILNGDEIGFFVKTKEGFFAKIILNEGRHSSTERDIKGRELEKDFILAFEYIYQKNGSNDLTYCPENFNLANYLIWNTIE
jgi:hypothetical protein